MQHGLGTACPRRQSQIHAREACPIPAARQDRNLSRQRHRRLQKFEPQPIPFQPGRRDNAPRFGRRLHQGQRPGRSEGIQQGLRILTRAMIQPISQENTFKPGGIGGA